jgi:hypothetical protein
MKRVQIGKFISRAGVLTPVDDTARNISAASGILFLSYPDQRSAANHKLFFQRIKAFCDNAGEEVIWNMLNIDSANSDTRTLVELVRKALLIDCGYVEQTVITHNVEIDGEVFSVKGIASTAKSISFDSMGENEFMELLQCVTNRMRDLLLDAGWDSMDVENLMASSE